MPLSTRLQHKSLDSDSTDDLRETKSDWAATKREHNDDHLLPTVMACLVLSPHTELVSDALDLLFRHFGENESFLNATTQVGSWSRWSRGFRMTTIILTCFMVQLLVSSCDIFAYQQLKTNLEELRRLTEQSELWMRKHNPADDGKVSSSSL
ncbi:hypothetical protein FBUS_00871 [Fasciolopsis buskii]|uniref:Uncharacterized protein n=1 Tax=Fasciolopsis buskii TaxID=27845 RepID=A0A8E0VK44_9TREM|nr:hypothetical protein FBUS_00871 [Fasciolopsis buski]